MNAYKLNGRAGHHYRDMICKAIGIPFTQIYKVVKDIKRDGTIILHDGREFIPELKQTKNSK